MKRFLMLCILMLATALLGSASVQAANVATYGNVNPSQLPAPHTGAAVTLVDIETGALSGYDVFWIGHAAFSAGEWSAEACTALDTFLADGGGIVTEWNGLTMLFDSLDPGIYLPMDLPQCGFFTGSVGNGNNLAADTPIDIVDPASPLVAGLTDPFVMAGGSQFFYTAGIDMAVWDVAAEFTGFGDTWPAVMSSSALGGVVAVGVMDYQDVLPGNANASILLGNLIAVADSGIAVDRPAIGYFSVTKTFTDGSTDSVDVMLTCNSGLPLEQTFTIDGGDPIGVTFVVTDLPEAGATCTVTETGGPDGYTPILNGGAGCEWTGVSRGAYTCEIMNEADPATFIVNKVWEVSEVGAGDEVIRVAEITITCDAEIVGGYQDDDSGSEDAPTGIILPSGDWMYDGTVTGDDSLEVEIDTSMGPATCSAEETSEQSGVESIDDCGPREIDAGETSECTITNTVFFEGIPSLNQYGLAIMALLMLGLGMVGFRRFV